MALPAKIVLKDQELAWIFSGLDAETRERLKREKGMVTVVPVGERWAVSFVPLREVKGRAVTELKRGYLAMAGVYKRIRDGGEEWAFQEEIGEMGLFLYELFDCLPKGTQEELRGDGLAPELLIGATEESGVLV